MENDYQITTLEDYNEIRINCKIRRDETLINKIREIAGIIMVGCIFDYEIYAHCAPLFDKEEIMQEINAICLIHYNI